MPEDQPPTWPGVGTSPRPSARSWPDETTGGYYPPTETSLPQLRPIPVAPPATGYPASGADAGSASSEGSGRRGPRSGLIVALVAAVIAVGGGAAFAVLHSHHGTSNQAGKLNPTATIPPSPSPTTSTSSTPASPRQQAADALAALLAQSVTDRTAVMQAVAAVGGCAPGLSQDVTTLTNAASSRQALLAKLANLPDRSALPTALLAALTTAWQASGQADSDFAKWAQDEASRGCSKNDQSDPNYRAAAAPDTQATAAKKKFAQLWTPIATAYTLPTYQYSQL
jgi:hypothetical protein